VLGVVPLLRAEGGEEESQFGLVGKERERRLLLSRAKAGKERRERPGKRVPLSTFEYEYL
jgi:hypothetical protein